MNDRCIGIATSLLLAFAAQALAQDKPAPKSSAAPPSATDTAKSPPPVEYRPPPRGAPGGRIGGSTRSSARGLSLVVVAPDHTGLASSNQPELFWYISQPVQAPLEFAIYAVNAADPLADKDIAPVSEAGIQRIRLADLGVKLESGEEYQWVISFAHRPGSRIKDAVASGRVRVQPLPADVAASVKAAGAAGGYAAYARAGYWYDAFSGLRREMSRHPNDAALADAQASLLEQVGLTEIARLERERPLAR